MTNPEYLHRLPPSSSSLIALSSIVASSPTPSPSLSVAPTFGEIPILLLGPEGPKLISCPNSHCESEAEPDEICILPSTSIDSVGTFGPTPSGRLISRGILLPHMSRKHDHLSDTEDDFTAATSVSASTILRTPLSVRPLPCEAHRDHHYASGSRFPISTHMPSLANDIIPDIAPNISQTSSHQQVEEHNKLQKHDETFSTIPDDDPKEVPISQSVLCPPNYIPQTPPRQTNESFLALLKHRKDSPVDPCIRSMTVEAAPVILESSRCGSAPWSPHIHSSNTQALYQSGWAAFESRYTTPHPVKPTIPVHLAWLDETLVEILIDQEGFRSVQARFRFCGYFLQRHWGYCNDGVARFRPATRQIFNFHYAPFDGLPVLRRVTVNGEDSRDYISRQASLCLKSNGVYTVNGSEASCLSDNGGRSSPRTADSHRLHWKFDYLVDDRKVDSSGKKAVDDEKVLTPLSFSCSPLLLHPVQGKKIKLMHIVKKSVATKLVAEKMEPPKIRTTKLSSLVVECARTPPLKIHTTTTNFAAPSDGWDMHRRAKSHAPRQAGENTSVDPFDTWLHSVAPQLATPLEFQRRTLSDLPLGPPRRRRASSAGERSWLGNVSVGVGDHSEPSYYPTKHIIPRSHLAELLDLDINCLVPPPTDPVDVPGFEPLAPSPRHRQARKESSAGAGTTTTT